MRKHNINNPYSILPDGSLQMAQTIFSPWPAFQVSGLPVEVPKRLHLLLTTSDQLPSIWREKIPEEVIAALLKFDTDLLPLLIPAAQVEPAKFVDWANFCPALIVLALHSAERFGKEFDNEKFFQLMHFGWRTVLVETGWSPERSTLKILQKVTSECLSKLSLGMLRTHLRNPLKLRMIRYLKGVDTAVIDTLHLPPEVLSVRLLELASMRSERLHADSMRELVEEILRFRKEVKRHPVWPYRHGQLSEETLHHAEQLLLMHKSMKSVSSEIRFPKPPFHVFKSSRFEARPICSARELYMEGLAMRNCLPGYAGRIASGNYLAYRILLPERASLLLFRSENGWRPVQLKTKGNGEPTPLTVKLVQAWLGENLLGKEVEDAPF